MTSLRSERWQYYFFCSERWQYYFFARSGDDSNKSHRSLRQKINHCQASKTLRKKSPFCLCKSKKNTNLSSLVSAKKRQGTFRLTNLKIAERLLIAIERWQCFLRHASEWSEVKASSTFKNYFTSLPMRFFINLKTAWPRSARSGDNIIFLLGAVTVILFSYWLNLFFCIIWQYKNNYLRNYDTNQTQKMFWLLNKCLTIKLLQKWVMH